MAEIYTYALGVIETRGFAVIVKSSDAIVKAAKVELTGYEEIVGSYSSNSFSSIHTIRIYIMLKRLEAQMWK